MKKILVAVALIIASAAPSLAHGNDFPNYYATNSDAVGN
jgi:hypothetical protein